MSISTTDIPEGGGGIQKVLQPGNRKTKINSIDLEPFPFIDDAQHVCLYMEGADLGEDFEGFFVNKEDESQGRYSGQVARVRANQYAYADGKTKSGIEVKRDTEILRFFKNLCKAIGPKALAWLDDQDGKFDTIQGIVEAFNADNVAEGAWFNCCLAGKEYANKSGYTNYDLYLPKFTKDGVPFENAEVDESSSRLVKYDETKHITKKKEAKEVEEFAGEKEKSATEEQPVTEETKGDFEL